MVLRDPPVSDLVETEDTLQYPESMFYFRSHSRLRRVLPLGCFVHIVFELRPPAGHILRVRRGLADRRGLALIAAIAPHLALFAVQQVGQYVHVRRRGRRGAYRMHHALFAVHADMRLQAEVLLLALARLLHLRVALTGSILRRAGCVEDSRIDDRSRGVMDASRGQMMAPRLQPLSTQLVPFKQVAEPADGGLVPALAQPQDPRSRSAIARPSHTAPLPRLGPTG